MRSLAMIAALAIALPAMAQATGQVVGADGKPIAGVDVCTLRNDERTACVKTDEKGFYRMEHPAVPVVYLQIKGYASKSVSAAPQNEPIVLDRVASLLVRVVDAATGEPIAEGTVSVNLTTGRKIGSPVPFNRAGVRMSTLAPGQTLVRADAYGYESGGPIVVELVGGQEKELTVRLKKLPTN
jgi:hypothetical protein